VLEAAQVGDRPQVLALSEVPRRRDRVDVLERRLPAERLMSRGVEARAMR